MNSLSYNIIFIVTVSLSFSEKDNSLVCKKLPNGCRLKSYYYEQSSNLLSFMLCHRLSQSFDFDNKTMNEMKKCKKSYANLLFQLYPSQILDSRYDFKKSIEFSLSVLGRYHVMFTNLKGISLNYFNNHSQQVRNKPFYLIIYHSKFQFFLQNSPINRCNDLKKENVNSIFQITSPLYKNLLKLINVQFKNSLCPLLFRNASFEYYIVFYMMNTFYRKNQQSFSQLESNTNENLGIQISELYFEKILNLNVDETLINKHVFRSINSLSLIGDINSIQQDLLGFFKKLKRIHFAGFKWRDLVNKKNGINWIKNLNSDVEFSFNSKEKMPNHLKEKRIAILLNNYQEKNTFTDLSRGTPDAIFPEEDFCLYKSFPFNQLIILINYLILNKKYMSCTNAWLNQYLEWFEDFQFKIEEIPRVSTMIQAKEEIKGTF